MKASKFRKKIEMERDEFCPSIVKSIPIHFLMEHGRGRVMAIRKGH